MGLGKSLQAVCLLHTLLTHPLLSSSPGFGGGAGGRVIYRAMLIAPVNTLANWETEFQKWVGISSERNIPAIRFYPWNDQKSKMKTITEWYDHGGILCVSLDKYASACKAFFDTESSKRGATSNKTATKKSSVHIKNNAFLRRALFQPGPDIVVLDEVHSMLKSNNTNIYKALCGMGTRLRLGLTGSPIQNNLYEYFRMANYVRPGCLGTEANFTKKFHDPIMDGMAADCTPLEADTQEQVSKELHGILAKFVHRRDADVLSKELPFLQETIIHVRQSRVQGKLYREFRKYQRETNNKSFFKQYHALRPVSNHPACLIQPDDKKEDKPTFDGTCGKVKDNQPRVAPDKYAWICDICQKAKFRTLDEAEEHEKTCDGTFDPNAVANCFDPDSAPIMTLQQSPGHTKKATENEEWWKSFAERAEKSDMDIKAIEHGGKIVLLLQIIAHCDAIGDKVVVFSQSLSTLSFIEEVLNSSDWCGFKLFLPQNTRKQNLGGWRRNKEYLRIDGSVDAKERGDLIDTFHSAGNQHSKLFLLSTNAGGLGINLIAANRVVIFDSHWNPAVDLQAVYRCYRYGQVKPVYCYRFLAEGTMEQKIYSRAAAKTSLSDLVIDQQNPERSFTRHELDLLRQEDTWVCCNACNKWRMLPTSTSEEVVANLPDEWYCKDNIYDPDRSNCAAEERTGAWMVSFYERRAREESGIHLLSQDSQGPQQEKSKTDITSAFAKRHHEYTERDEVLQILLERSEETGKDTSSGKMRWVSKWDFTFDKTEKFEPTVEKEKAPKTPTKEMEVLANKVKPPTGNMKCLTKEMTTPTKEMKSTTKEMKSTTKKGKSLSKEMKSPTKETKSPIKEMKSPIKEIKSSSRKTTTPTKEIKSTTKKVESPIRNGKSSTEKSSVKTRKVKSEQKENHRSPSKKTQRPITSSERKLRSSAKLATKRVELKEEREQQPIQNCSSGKKRKSSENTQGKRVLKKMKVESKSPLKEMAESKSPLKEKAESKSLRKKKAKRGAVVDLTLSESDSD